MDELIEMREDLRGIAKSINNMIWIYEWLPDIPRLDCEEILDEVKYLCGFVDCMIINKIKLKDPVPLS